jgi:hypothetical protein
MESKREKICSKETLDMSPQNWDPESDNYNTYLVPPVLQAQIELLTTVAVLLPMKQAVLKGLQALMKANQTKSWFAVYLCLFILLHSCSLLTKAESMRAKREPQYDHNEARVSYHLYIQALSCSKPLIISMSSRQGSTMKASLKNFITELKLCLLISTMAIRAACLSYWTGLVLLLPHLPS